MNYTIGTRGLEVRQFRVAGCLIRAFVGAGLKPARHCRTPIPANPHLNDLGLLAGCGDIAALPEAPELEVVREFLDREIVGSRVTDFQVLRPGVLRPMAGSPEELAGRRIEGVWRIGKFLGIGFTGGASLVVNPMLTGSFQYSEPADRVYKKTCFVMSMDGGRQLRYLDGRRMGRAYYVRSDSMSDVPQFDSLGVDILAPDTFEDFAERMKPFRGEIKGVITRGRVVSGIGNAYVDEILFEAELYPFKKRTSLSDEELRRLYEAARKVVRDAVDEVRARMGGDIQLKPRDFLKVHNRGGEPCPRCGNKITQLTANQRITSYCRRCQPGLLIKT